jgi:ornithine decarboxylase
MTPRTFKTVRQAIKNRETDLPLLCIRPQIAAGRAREFARKFPGTVAYAIKVQPNELILNAIAAGVAASGKPVAFDVASLNEIKLARSNFPDSKLFFMHPMKKDTAIKEAYHDYRVRDFVIDHRLELQKLSRAGVGRDATVLVRIATPQFASSGSAPAYNLSDKFGAEKELAEVLLRDVERAGYRPGVAFHVGSQEKKSEPWKQAIKLTRELREASGVPFNILDVGGGFPGVNANTDVKTVDQVFNEVMIELNALRSDGFELVAEPGRAIVYDSMSVVAEVVGKKEDTRMRHGQNPGRALYIDEGIWSTLSESLTASKNGNPWMWPVHCYTASSAPCRLVPYFIGGVTCDSVDVLEGEYLLPDTIEIGDFVEFGDIGAYGTALTSKFNGFGSHEAVIIEAPFYANYWQDSLNDAPPI